MSWQPVEGFTIVWTDKAAYQRQLGEIIEAQLEKLHATSKPNRPVRH
jgi:phosphopantetheinyl transferase